MKSRKGTTSSAGISEKKNESAKLASLLTLAAGALAAPQTAGADVIVTDLGASPGNIGHLGSPSFTISNLPGTARLGFQLFERGTTSLNYKRTVVAGQVAGYVRLKTNAFLAVHVPAGSNWNQVAGNAANAGTVGWAYFSTHAPNSYNHEYILFEFKDSTQGNAMLYGWAEVSLFNANISSSEGPEVTVWRYAYDNTGAPLASGSVPEPSSAALLVLGALALGSKGLRLWRSRSAS